MDNIIGRSVERVDAALKARGRAMYSGDYHMENMLECVLVRAREAHARLISVEVPQLPDGCFCYTARDLHSNLIPSIMNDQPVFASDHVRYYGEPVAIIASPTPEMAKKLASQVRVVLEPIEMVDDWDKALDESTPKLFEKGNLCCDFHSDKGDVEKGFAESDIVYEETFHMPTQCHGFMETEASFTYMDENGRLSLIASTQNAWSDKNTICSVLGLDADQVTSRAGTVGGAFGGKDGNTSQIYAAIVTHFTGRPARIVFSREENIRYGMKRHPGTVKVKVGFRKDGKLVALKGYMCLDTGAYAILGPAVLGLGLEHMSGPYLIPSVKLDGNLVYTNHAPASAMRGFGAPQSAIGIESFLNRAARELGMDYLEIRKINAIHRNEVGSLGGLMEHCTDFDRALELFGKSAFYDEMKNHPEEGYGYGIAAGMMSSGMGKNVPDDCYSVVERLSDDHYRVSTSLVDIGQGSQTALAMIAAEALQVPFENIDMVMGITEGQGNSGSTAASRSTFVAGNAILEAIGKLKENGSAREESKFTFPEVSGKGVHAFFSFMVQGVKLKVDRDTGEIRLVDFYNVTETGKVINPTLLAGQAFGGILMSSGYALSEQIRYKDGISRENNLNSYVMLTALDAPHLANDNVDAYDEMGPFGAKGIAECSTVPTAPAIVAAVNQLYPDLKITKLPIERLQLIRRS